MSIGVKECNDLVARIHALPQAAKSAITVACAELLMNEYLARPTVEQDPFIRSWVSTLPLIWKAIEAPNVSLAARFWGIWAT
jgi:hypothetical protein